MVQKGRTTHPKAFTLIELLVVITILVILLALLTPALDKAMYQAELTLCASNVKAIAVTAHIYTADFHRRYPHRPGVGNIDAHWGPTPSLGKGSTAGGWG